MCIYNDTLYIWHVVGRCPQLDVTFPFMLPGWSAELIGGYYDRPVSRLARRRSTGSWTARLKCPHS